MFFYFQNESWYASLEWYFIYLLLFHGFMHGTRDYFYSIITFSHTKYFVHSYTVGIVFTLSYLTEVCVFVVSEVKYPTGNEISSWVKSKYLKKSNSTSIQSITQKCLNQYPAITHSLKHLHASQTRFREFQTEILRSISYHNSRCFK